MVYHSSFKDLPPSIKISCGIPLLPLRTNTKGPSERTTDFDIVDEAIEYFRPNVLFRKFQIESDADKLLIYLTLYISQCLKRLLLLNNNNNNNMTEGAKALFALAHEQRDVEISEISLGGIISEPKTFEESEIVKQYLTQCREEIGVRLIDHCFIENNKPNKFWMAFAKKKFMNKELPTSILY
jgi:actin related protein 2/3 complex, subunit 3